MQSKCLCACSFFRQSIVLHSRVVNTHPSLSDFSLDPKSAKDRQLHHIISKPIQHRQEHPRLELTSLETCKFDTQTRTLIFIMLLPYQKMRTFFLTSHHLSRSYSSTLHTLQRKIKTNPRAISTQVHTCTAISPHTSPHNKPSQQSRRYMRSSGTN